MPFRAVILSLCLALGSAAGVPAAERPRSVLIVVKPDNPRVATDRAIKAHLETLGYRVTIGSQYDPADKAAAGHDLVILSSNIRSRDLLTAYRTVRVPVLTWESDLLDDLGMAGKMPDTDFGKADKVHALWMVNAPHPLSGGLGPGIVNVYARDAPVNWGKPGLGASIIATVPGHPEQAAIYGYEKGATMDYETIAPARRVMIFLDNETFGNLTPSGLALFDAAVRWSRGEQGR